MRHGEQIQWCGIPAEKTQFFKFYSDFRKMRCLVSFLMVRKQWSQACPHCSWHQHCQYLRWKTHECWEIIKIIKNAKQNLYINKACPFLDTNHKLTEKQKLNLVKSKWSKRNGPLYPYTPTTRLTAPVFAQHCEKPSCYHGGKLKLQYFITPSKTTSSLRVTVCTNSVIFHCPLFLHRQKTFYFFKSGDSLRRGIHFYQTACNETESAMDPVRAI